MIDLRLSGLTASRLVVVQQVIRAALAAVDPRAAVSQAAVTPSAGAWLEGCERVRVVGVGKASQAMALGLLDALGERVVDGIIITKHVDPASGLPQRVRVLVGGHPLPSAQSVAGAREVTAYLAGSRPGDLVFCLISGGGSALMSLPVEGVSLEDLQSLTRLLLGCGADITEINTLRKHLDRVKGGGLARLAAPARVVALVLSDVIGSPLEVIASGPTVADPTTFASALAILDKYHIRAQALAAIRDVLERGMRGDLPETVKPGSPILDRVTTLVIGSNVQAAEAGLAEARAAGFHAHLLMTDLAGEAAQAGERLAAALRQVAAEGQPIPRPACLAAGGETTVTLRGSGMGGRNQELALAAVPALSGLPDVALLTLGTDGEDGPTDAAGALVTGETLARARAAGLDPAVFLANNDSYHFFQALGDLVITGPTGTNVNDLAFLFAFPPG
ncbi:MAG TPA: glycerate kinase [Anaerolineaceae bacterium]